MAEGVGLMGWIVRVALQGKSSADHVHAAHHIAGLFGNASGLRARVGVNVNFRPAGRRQDFHAVKMRGLAVAQSNRCVLCFHAATVSLYSFRARTYLCRIC